MYTPRSHVRADLAFVHKVHVRREQFTGSVLFFQNWGSSPFLNLENSREAISKGIFMINLLACKHQRKKCEPNCQLAPYFPSTKDEDFQNVYRLFGVNNTIKHINSVADDQRAKLVETLILEAKIRKENPVHGCLAIERKLRAEIEALEKELEMVQNNISFCKKMSMLQMTKQHLEEELDRSSLALVSPFDAHSMTRF